MQLNNNFFIGDMAESVDATDLKVLFIFIYKLSLLEETLIVNALKFREIFK